MEKGGPEGYPFLQPTPPFSATRRTAFLCSPPARPSVFSAAFRKFTFFIWKHSPPDPPALQLVLSWIRLSWCNLNKRVSLSFKLCASCSVRVMRCGYCSIPMVFGLTLTFWTFIFFFSLLFSSLGVTLKG